MKHFTKEEQKKYTESIRKVFTLPEDNHLLTDKGKLTDRVQELEAQIEKMKCCENCKYYNNHYNEVVCKRQVINCKRILRQATRDQWEIKEND